MSDSAKKLSKAVFLGAILLLASVLLVFVFYDGLWLMVNYWGRDEYSHGFMIPFVSAFLVWKKREALSVFDWRGAWTAIGVLVVALFVYLLGELSALYTLVQYGFWLALVAICLALVGWKGVRIIWVPLVYLLFMIPLPNFLYNNLSQDLQIISSQLGVWVIRLFDISVYLEGNVIDLGSYQLQVVEACSGLNYLFPLMSFGFLVAYLYQAPFWQRALVFITTVPITIVMNSFRIGVIGVLVEHWGIDMAEGFLHFFEGWLVFMASLGVLLLEIYIFHRFSGQSGSLWTRLDLLLPESAPAMPNIQWRNQKPLLCCLGLLLAAAPASVLLEERQDNLPERDSLHSFPLALDGYLGREGYIEPEVIESLKLTDYIIADYRSTVDATPVNFYIAYYDSQRKGASVHSPRSCIPGGGWQIEDLSEKEISSLRSPDGSPVKVMRVVIRKGNAQQLVYYWLQQRGRMITNEYMAKWYIFWDALTRNRTDGALVRIVAPVFDGDEISEVDDSLVDFMMKSYPLLGRYIPD